MQTICWSGSVPASCQCICPLVFPQHRRCQGHNWAFIIAVIRVIKAAEVEPSQARLFPSPSSRDWFSSACCSVRNLHSWKVFLTREQLTPLVRLCPAYLLLARHTAPRTWWPNGWQFEYASLISKTLVLTSALWSQLTLFHL